MITSCVREALWDSFTNKLMDRRFTFDLTSIENGNQSFISTLNDPNDPGSLPGAFPVSQKSLSESAHTAEARSLPHGSRHSHRQASCRLHLFPDAKLTLLERIRDLFHPVFCILLHWFPPFMAIKKHLRLQVPRSANFDLLFCTQATI